MKLLHWLSGALIASLLGCATAPPPAKEPDPVAEELARCQRAQRELHRKIDQLELRLQDERQRSEAMQRKIESLRAIDREMTMKRKAR